jgi:DNA-binding response OmpR family regulator
VNVLLVEDDHQLGGATARGLTLEGHVVDWKVDGYAADAAKVENRYDAVVLDLGLPSIGGEELLKLWRERQDHTPVIVLTARGLVLDRVRMLNLGADDYMVKPFDLLELSARLLALYRRNSRQQGMVLECGPLTMSREERTVRWHGQPVDLTNREFRVLEALLRNRERILSRRQLEDTLYGLGEEVDSNAVEVHIHNLRRKLSRGLIQTVRGAGYRVQPLPGA